MPQASEELRREWMASDADSDAVACRYLEAQGYRQTREWQWIKPKPDHVITEKEGRALQFLFEEWDYGGVVTAPDGPE